MKSSNVVTVSRVAKRLLTFSICLAALLLLGQLFGQTQVKESKVVQHYKELAEQGRVDIQFRLGELYDPDTPAYSRGADNPRQTKGQPLALAVNKSFTEAAKWYRMAAIGGNVPAQARLADISRDGKLSSVDLTKATHTVTMSAPTDVSRQKPVKEPKEVQQLKEAAMKGRVQLQSILGELYDPDNGRTDPGKLTNRGAYAALKTQPLTSAVTKSYAEAVKWYKMAADGGSVAAQARLGDIYREGKLGAVDLTRPAVAANPDLKLLKRKATDVKYVVGAVGNAEVWAQAADASGTAEEKALAHKWLDAHKQAQRFDVECRGCASPPTRTEAYAGKSEFYKHQGKEFKAFAQYWDSRWVRADELETGEHIPTTAEILGGVAADATGVIAQGRAQASTKAAPSSSTQGSGGACTGYGLVAYPPPCVPCGGVYEGSAYPSNGQIWDPVRKECTQLSKASGGGAQSNPVAVDSHGCRPGQWIPKHQCISTEGKPYECGGYCRVSDH